ncbi:isoaspartyl peptidase/L-asparaginase, partial [Desulforudis sp. 1190]|uniref:isoaspartyl peptidase/L-asparaginase n=1 Tax=Desulforudis sp. 1190 TaxID=3416136 RepID=UPI003CE8B9C0
MCLKPANRQGKRHCRPQHFPAGCFDPTTRSRRCPSPACRKADEFLSGNGGAPSRIETRQADDNTDMGIIAVHGGLDTSREQEFMALLKEAALRGHNLLIQGRVPALEAVLNLLEDSPRFNCGYGSVLNLDGEVEMDAAIVDGGTNRFAAVAAIREVANPISVARKLMEETKQVMLAGEGAIKFARRHHFPEANCITREQLEAWRKAKDSLSRGEMPAQNLFTGLEYRADTVGCVCWDGQA